MITVDSANDETLQTYNVEAGSSSVSGLSSGAFMAVQLHIAHSASFCGAGIVAGGPYRCAESFRKAAFMAEDAFEQSAFYICMSPLVPQTAPNVDLLRTLAHDTEAAGKIDRLANLANDRIYIFTGRNDNIVSPEVVACTRRFYEILGVGPAQIAYHANIHAGHALLTANPEDSLLEANLPPWLNNNKSMQSHAILDHIYDNLHAPSGQPSGRLLRFRQDEFIGDQPSACMSPFGYVYVPRAVEEGAPARVHIALHGCKQGYEYVNFVHGRRDVENQPPYGNRWFTTTGYNHMADSNNIIVLYPQITGRDDDTAQNPDGCWDWWGYTGDPRQPDYYSREAPQIKAIHAMLRRLGG